MRDRNHDVDHALARALSASRLAAGVVGDKPDANSSYKAMVHDSGIFLH